MLNFKRVCIGVLLAFLFHCSSSRFVPDPKRSRNPRWICRNCEQYSHLTKQQVFGLCRHAMLSESREVYLAFDHSWLDSRALQQYARVVVTIVPRNSLASLEYNASTVLSHVKFDGDNEGMFTCALIANPCLKTLI